MELKGNIIISAEDILYQEANSLVKYIINNFYPNFCTKIKEIPVNFNSSEREYKSVVLSLAKPNITQNQLSSLVKNINNYYNDKNIYENYFKLTKFGVSISNNIPILESDVINNIIIVYDDNKPYILDLLKSNFKHHKYVFTSEKMFDILCNNKWNLVITDNIYEIEKYLTKEEKPNINNKEFLFLDSRYCKPDQAMRLLIEERGGMINFLKGDQ